MTEPDQVFEKYGFFSSRKGREIFSHVLETLLPLSVDEVTITYSDRPDESFRHINDRTRKILVNHPDSDKIDTIVGTFADGGSFELRGGTLTISVSSDQYNFDLVDSMKRFLSPVFPVCVFQNPYIWGVDLYEGYTRELFFETRAFIARNPHLEEPEIDIFRRDDGIIYKFRFHPREELSVDEGIRHLAPFFMDLGQALRKRMYEGLEVLHTYCTEKASFRRLEPRTKIGRDVKSILSDHR
ncbi:MAG: hypothetical protein GX442_02555 [Candidatus Riflebacteria bacterium]|nr:hypothetical protein [Candidatus Riflebacteria bacterium]